MTSPAGARPSARALHSRASSIRPWAEKSRRVRRQRSRVRRSRRSAQTSRSKLETPPEPPHDPPPRRGRDRGSDHSCLPGCSRPAGRGTRVRFIEEANCFVSAPVAGVETREVCEDVGRSRTIRRFLEQALTHLQRLGYGRGTVVHRGGGLGQAAGGGPPGSPVVPSSTLGGVEPVRAASLQGAAGVPERAPGAAEGALVFRLLEERGRSSHESDESSGSPPRCNRARASSIPDHAADTSSLIATASSIAWVNAASAAAESPSWLRVIPSRRGSPPVSLRRRGATTQHGRGGWPPPLHPLASTRQFRPQPARDLRALQGRGHQDRRGRALAVAMCLLEVVADELVRGPASLLEPRAETVVQLCPNSSSSPA